MKSEIDLRSYYGKHPINLVIWDELKLEKAFIGIFHSVYVYYYYWNFVMSFLNLCYQIQISYTSIWNKLRHHPGMVKCTSISFCPKTVFRVILAADFPISVDDMTCDQLWSLTENLTQGKITVKTKVWEIFKSLIKESYFNCYFVFGPWAKTYRTGDFDGATSEYIWFHLFSSIKQVFKRHIISYEKFYLASLQ